MEASHAQNLKERDGGLASRKLWLTVFTMVLVFGSGLLAGYWQPFAAGMNTIVSGLIGCLSLYLVGNVSSKWAIGKTHPAVKAKASK